MEGKSKMVDILSQVAALGSKVDNEIKAQEAALAKLREEKDDLLTQQREALVDGDSAAYVSATKKLEGKQMLIDFSEKRLRQLKGRNVAREKEIEGLCSALSSAALEDLLAIEARAIPAIDAVLELCDQADAVQQACNSAVSAMTSGMNIPDIKANEMSYRVLGVFAAHNSLQLLHQRIKNIRQTLEAEIQRGR